jgi:hypothetical protein
VTRNGDFKKLVRARMRRAGESYSTARANLWRRRPHIGPPAPAVLTQRELDELPDADLVARCAAPISMRMHVAAPASERRAFLRRLTASQGALLVFSMLFTRAEGGLTGFYWSHPHRMADADFWTLLQIGLENLGDRDLLSVVERLRIEVARAAPDPPSMAQLDDEFRRAIPGSVGVAARLIRDHVAEFVTIQA